MNRRMYSWIDQHGDRQTTGDLQFEEMWAKFPQIVIAHALSVTGVLAPTDANLAFGPAERKGGLRPAPMGIQTAGSMAQDVGRLLRNFGTIAPQYIGCWASTFGVFGTTCWVSGTRSIVFGTGNWVLGTRSGVLGSAVGEIPT